MKKSIIIILFILQIFLLSSFASALISIEPIEVSIKIENNFNQGNSTKKITIQNKDNQNFNATWYIEHPTLSKIRQNRTRIPDLSWIDVEPKYKNIPPNEKADFYIYTNIPKKEEYIDKHWEVWVTFKGGIQNQNGGIFNLEHAIRIYIDTPKNLAENHTGFEEENKGLTGISTDNADDLHITNIGLLIIAITVLIAIFLFYKKKKQ